MQGSKLQEAAHKEEVPKDFVSFPGQCQAALHVPEPHSAAVFASCWEFTAWHTAPAGFSSWWHTSRQPRVAVVTLCALGCDMKRCCETALPCRKAQGSVPHFSFLCSCLLSLCSEKLLVEGNARWDLGDQECSVVVCPKRKQEYVKVRLCNV